MIAPFCYVSLDTVHTDAAVFSDRHCNGTIYDVSLQRRGYGRSLLGAVERVTVDGVTTWWVTHIERRAIAPYMASSQQDAADWLTEQRRNKGKRIAA